jgi:soluble lytic murein transglycosylase-like protein
VIPVPVAAVLLALTLIATAPATRVATTVQVDAVVPAAAPAWAHCPQWWDTARAAGWADDQLPTVDRVMWCESRCHPHAHNPSGATGLMQIMPGWWHGRDPYDPATNLTIAVEVHDRQGWRAWSCY